MTQRAALPDRVAGASGLELVDSLGPFGRDFKHVQGLAVTDEHLFITSVDTAAAAGRLFRVNRRSGRVELERDFARERIIHPGGIQLAGGAIFLPMAVCRRESRAEMLRIDPRTLEATSRFEVADHIGCAASDGESRIFGGNWDSRIIYEWAMDGTPLAARPNPTEHAYQDMEYHDGFLIGSGSGAVDWIDVERWSAVKTLRPGAAPSGADAAREGVCCWGDRLWFLPDDGDGRVYVYDFTQAGDGDQ